ncbi:MAG: Rab family GTPase, partial [Promethearchaeota archaeon]
MEKDPIVGIIYSQFNEKLGPISVAWIPMDLSQDVRTLVSLKSINILVGEQGSVPEYLALIPFPSLNLKGIIKNIEITDRTRRGGTIDSSITLLFNELDDPIFYKYLNNFEEIFNETVTRIKKLEELKAKKKQIEEELKIFYDKITNILNELCDFELTCQEAEEFPKEKKELAEIQRFRYKIIVCGDPVVGKTSLVLRFTDIAFKRSYIPTIGTSISEKFVQIENIKIEFVIWDIAGQAKFRIMRKHFYVGADGLLLIFDLTRPETFKNIINWYEDIKSILNKELHGFILGNKSDLVDARKVSEKEIFDLANQLKLEYIETSALSGENVDKAFYKLGELLIAHAKIKEEKK